jgi:hypothetical protein
MTSSRFAMKPCLVHYLTAVAALEWVNDPKNKNCVPDTTTLSSKEADIELRNEVRAIVPWLKKRPPSWFCQIHRFDLGGDPGNVSMPLNIAR